MYTHTHHSFLSTSLAGPDSAFNNSMWKSSLPTARILATRSYLKLAAYRSIEHITIIRRAIGVEAFERVGKEKKGKRKGEGDDGL